MRKILSHRKRNLQRFKKPKRIFRRKLLKRYRFWRSFKYFFLFKKKIWHFTQFKWLFNNKRILKHQFLHLYGNSLKKICFNHKAVYGFNTIFYSLLSKIEFRVMIYLCRIRFCFNLKASCKLICDRVISINGNIAIKRSTLVTIGGTVAKSIFLRLRVRRPCVHMWRWYRWGHARSKIRRNRRRRYTNVFIYPSIITNYIEINYKIMTSLLIRFPLYGEILINKNRKMCIKRLYKQLYYLY